MKELKAQLELLKNIKPQDERLVFCRERVLRKIRFAKFSENPESFWLLSFKETAQQFLHPLRLARSFSVVTAMILVIALAGAGTVGAAFNSLPDSKIYSLKITVKKMVFFPSSQEKKAKSKIALAEDIKEDIDKVIRKESSSSKKKAEGVKKGVEHLKKMVDDASQQIEKMANKKQAVDTAEKVKESANNLRIAVKEIPKQISQAVKKEEGNEEETEEETQIVEDILVAVEAATTAAEKSLQDLKMESIKVIVGKVEYNGLDLADAKDSVQAAIAEEIEDLQVQLGEETREESQDKEGDAVSIEEEPASAAETAEGEPQKELGLTAEFCEKTLEVQNLIEPITEEALSGPVEQAEAELEEDSSNNSDNESSNIEPEELAEEEPQNTLDAPEEDDAPEQGAAELESSESQFEESGESAEESTNIEQAQNTLDDAKEYLENQELKKAVEKIEQATGLVEGISEERHDQEKAEELEALVEAEEDLISRCKMLLEQEKEQETQITSEDEVVNEPQFEPSNEPLFENPAVQPKIEDEEGVLGAEEESIIPEEDSFSL